MKIKIALYLFLVSFISNNKSENASLEIKSILELPKEDYVLDGTLTMNYVENNQNSYLYYCTPNIRTREKELLIYNLKTKKLDKKMFFSKQNGFENSISSFIYVNKDSILYTSKNDSLYLTNLKQEILDKVKFKFDVEGNEISNATNWIYTPISYCKNNLYFTPFSYGESKEVYKNKKFIYKYDLISKEIKPLKTIFPVDFLNSEFFSSHVYSCFDGKNLIYSPLNSHDLWIVNIENGDLKKVDTKSKYFREFKKYVAFSEIAKPLTMQDYQYINCFYSLYSSITYDKYRKVYYRFFYPGHDVEKNSKKLAELNRNPEKVSIIILDEKFNKIGETLFENKNLSNLFFVSPEGLFVSLKPKSELENVTHLKFAKITLQYEKN